MAEQRAEYQAIAKALSGSNAEVAEAVRMLPPGSREALYFACNRLQYAIARFRKDAQ